MKIWIIDHYSVPPKYYPLARNSMFAKHLMNLGYSVKIIAASTVHNSNINLISDNSKYKEINEDGISYVLIKCIGYFGNGINRIINMLEFSFKLKRVCNKFEKPDVIISQSMTLNACAAGIKLAKEYKCKCIAQITDLWPETIVEYGIAKKYNPIVLYLRRLEKWIYKNADRIVFSMEGAYDYITEQNWQKHVPFEKVCFINNGVDFDTFNENKVKNIVPNCDLLNRDYFDVVYIGSIRRVNGLGLLLDAAKLINNKRIRIFIWGDGEQKNYLESRVIKENIENVYFKEKVEKKYIPYIVSNADLCLIHNSETPLLRFGVSMNKIFDCLASGKPLLFDFSCKYNPAIDGGAGLMVEKQEPAEIAWYIEHFASMPKDEYDRYCENALKVAKEYDFKNLTNRLVSVINSIN